MKKIILTLALVVCAIQAQDVVHYDTKTVKKPAMTKPNCPTSDLYSK